MLIHQNWDSLGLTLQKIKNKASIFSLCLNLSKVSYIIKSLRGVLSPFVLRSIYFPKFQSLLRYGIIFWGGKSGSIKVLRMQKRVLWTIRGVDKWESCRQILKDYKILTVTSLFILEVLCWIKKHNGNLTHNVNIHE